MSQFGNQTRASVWAQAANSDANLDAAERQRILDRAVANLKQYYYDRDVAQKTADALMAHEKNGDDNQVKQGGAFADLLTRQMRDASQDMHLVMEYSQNPLPGNPPVQTADSLARFRLPGRCSRARSGSYGR